MKIKNPKWANKEHTMIDCFVRNNMDEYHPFTADKFDVEEHGREIFNVVASGAIGKIEEYVEYVEPPREERPIILKPKQDPEIEVF